MDPLIESSDVIRLQNRLFEIYTHFDTGVLHMKLNGLLVVVPLYKQPDLIPDLFRSLIDVCEELRALHGSILIINDSPDHAPLAEAISAKLPALADVAEVELHINDVNLGFVRSCNMALAKAKAGGLDVLLLNSDALLTKGALTELAAVARLDALTSVVSPRSNNATICNSPYPDSFRTLGVEAAHAAHLAIQNYLPRVTYVPTAVGFCLYIRNLMLQEFGDFDLVYGAGYNEENDFIMRCNQRGYRAILANHSFVYHKGSVSFGVSEESTESREGKNALILRERYPEYTSAIAHYFGGIEFKAQELLAGLVPTGDGKRRILFDCRHIGPYHNGTFEHAKRLIAAFVRKYHHRFECYIACNHDALIFHGFDKINWLSFCWNDERSMRPFAAVLRPAQPFDHDTLVDIANLAPITGYLMLDTIAMDILRLDTQDLSRLWLDMLDTSTMIGFISEFTRDQFNRRFSIPDTVVTFLSLCSVDEREYVDEDNSIGNVPLEKARGHILVVGNQFPHKNIARTLDLLRAIKDRPNVVVLGVEIEARDGIVGYPSGNLSQAFVDSLYDDASAVLFPSDYEGFGLPILHALARKKPIILRDLPLFQEIKDISRHGDNMHMVQTTQEAVELAINPPLWRIQQKTTHVPNWEDAATSIAEGIDAAIAAFNYPVFVRRLLRADNRRALSWTNRRVNELVNLSKVSFDGLDNDTLQEEDPLNLRNAMLNRKTERSWKKHVRKLFYKHTIDASPVTPVEKPLFGAQLNLRIPDTLEFSDLVNILLDWSDVIPNWNSLELRIVHSDMPHEAFELFVKQCQIALLNAGFFPTGCHRILDVIIVSTWKVKAWKEALDGVEDAAEYVAKCYTEILRREQDPDGATYHLGSLKSGSPRENVLRSFLNSNERLELVERFYGDSALTVSEPRI